MALRLRVTQGGKEWRLESVSEKCMGRKGHPLYLV